ncbi:MAG: alpha/beta hydrolase-fold protein [Chitinophagaceae bacterium]|nr:alpha/beta hydrolase-fold protein [Chitinophagaceae bacterium]
MSKTNTGNIRTEYIKIYSSFLKRIVKLDFYLPAVMTDHIPNSVLLINDGQDLVKMPFEKILNSLYEEDVIKPLLCCGIHAGPERKQEYGTSSTPDYKGRGAKAPLYTRFIIDELLPKIKSRYGHYYLSDHGFAGFSLGGLSALDIAWNHPEIFSKVGVFSGSLWWRSVNQHDPAYRDEQHRIMHQIIRNSEKKPNLKFFFQCGQLDETEDRNGNGIIDSIDDTLDLIRELEAKGYLRNKDIHYLELENGRHDVETWALAFPYFLKWGWKKEKEKKAVS